METWVFFAIGAAFFQNIRSVVQKNLLSELDIFASSFVRFFYALPLCLAISFLLKEGFDTHVPKANEKFLIFAVLGGSAQILATILLIYLFTLKKFAVGGAFKKTEALISVGIGFLILQETVSLFGLVAILAGIIGLILISKTKLNEGLFNWGSLVGLLCGLMFSFSAVFYRGATLALDSGEFYIRAILTLNYVLLYQTLIFGVILFLFSRTSFISVFSCWRTGWVAGLSGMLASFGWFSAMNLAHVSYVKAVGQIELLFAVGAGFFLFKEKLSSREILGIFFIGLSIVLLIF